MPPSLARPGFSFVEVLFAVIILGVGFIMIAAVFPVAIRQTKNTVDETSAAAIARAGANYIAQYATNANMPSDGSATAPGSMISIPMTGIPKGGNSTYDTSSFTLWRSIRGNVVSQDDPRYAYVSMYFRGGDVNNNLVPAFVEHPYVQIVTICVQATEAPTFGLSDYYYQPNDAFAHRVNLQPRPIEVQIINGAPGDVDLIAIQNDPNDSMTGGGDTGSAADAAVEGAYVVLRTDTTASNGALIGSIYRLGARRADMDGQPVTSYRSATKTAVTLPAGATVWELAPGNDFTPIPAGAGGSPPAVDPPDAAPTEAWIVGKWMTYDATAHAYSFSGAAMDVSAYSTYVAVSQ